MFVCQVALINIILINHIYNKQYKHIKSLM